MGLDNGLVVKAKSLKGLNYLSKQDYIKKEHEGSSDYEIGYWRKCWNIRSVILHTFRYKDYDGDGGYINLTSVGDLIDFREALKYFLSEDAWMATDYGSIWEWHEALPGIAMAIRNITFLIKDIEMEEVSLNDLNIYFYDSY